LPLSTETQGNEAASKSRAADDRWLSDLYREHHKKVLGAAYRLTGSAADAEDVLQTVFVRLAGRAGGGEAVELGAGYLRRAAVNGALDVLRSRARLHWTDAKDSADTVDPGPGPEASVRGRELEGRLRRALGEETPRAAEIFALRCFEGCEYKEIAALVGTSRAVVAVTLHRVRARLQRKLGETT
jgi:RNA polymerase sigma-70 factor (ECF subfamily)